MGYTQITARTQPGMAGYMRLSGLGVDDADKPIPANNPPVGSLVYFINVPGEEVTGTLKVLQHAEGIVTLFPQMADNILEDVEKDVEKHFGKDFSKTNLGWVIRMDTSQYLSYWDSDFDGSSTPEMNLLQGAPGESKSDIETEITTRLNAFNVITEVISITDFQFSPLFAQAIESKVEAEQKALKAENDLRRIQVEARQNEAHAQGLAKANIAEAQGEAEAIRIINEALAQNPNYLEWLKTQAWDGKLPLVVGQGGTPFIQIPTRP